MWSVVEACTCTCIYMYIVYVYRPAGVGYNMATVCDMCINQLHVHVRMYIYICLFADWVD